MKRYPLQVRHKQDWGRGFIFLLRQSAALPGSDAGSDVVNPASSFVIQNLMLHVVPDVWGHAISTWSAVCSAAPHSQFGEGARPHLCMDKWNCPTPVLKRLSLTQAARDKLIPTGFAPVLAQKHGAWKNLHSSLFRIPFMFFHSEARMPSPASLPKRFCAVGTNGCLDLSLSWRVFEHPLKRPYKI